MRKILLTLMIAAIPVFAYADVIFFPGEVKRGYTGKVMLVALVTIAVIFVLIRRKIKK